MNGLPSHDDDPLDALLKSQRPSIPDDGFSARVLASLPEPSPVRNSPARRQRILVTGAALAGLAVAFLRSGFSPAIELQKAGRGLDVAMQAFSDVNAPMLWTSAIVIAGSLCFAFQREIVRALERI